MAAGRWVGRIVLAAAGAGAGWLMAMRASALDAPVTTAGWETAAVEQRDVGATVLATGVVRARVGAQVTVGSRVSGVLRRLHVTVGDAVQAGQLLAELDRVEYETGVARAEAMLSSATAERAWAEGEHRRVQDMMVGGAATRAELASAERAMDAARAREQEARAALEAARVQLDYTSIRAPISGIVATVSTQEGETVAASFAAPTFLTIVDLSRLEVQAYVDETDIGRVRSGQRARFTVDTWPDDAFEGRVTAVRPTAELRDNVVNYVTLIAIEARPGRLLRPEMTATINIELEGRNGVTAVPNAALRRDAAGTFVLVATAAGVERRDVTVGFRGSDFSEVASGLEVGELVAVGQATECVMENRT